MSTTVDTANRQIARAAGTVMAAFVLSNLAGLLRQILVSRAFGTGAEIDAFNAAARLPDLLFNLVAGGALASAFIPTFTGFLVKGDRQEAWQLASAVLNLVSLLLAVISALAALFAPLVVRYVLYILIPNLDPAHFNLTVALLRVLLLSPVIFGVSGLLMGILNAHQVFLLPALAPTFYWLGMIFGVLFLVPSLGIFGLAWGAVLGSVLHLAVQLPALGKIGAQYFASLGLRLPPVREVGRLMAPRLLGVAVVQINFLVNTILASAQPQGSLTALTIAWAVMTMPQVVIAQAIAIAALPTFSAQVSHGRLEEMRSSLAATLRGVTFLALPASLGLILLRKPVIALLFQRGEFDANSTDLVAWALLWYSAGLLGHSVVEILARAFYALHDTKTPVLVGVAAMSLNLLFSVLFSSLFSRLGLPPHGGLALANSLATALEMVGLLILMRRKLGGLEGGRLWGGFAQASLGSLVMSLGLWAWMSQSTSWPAWVVVAGGVLLGAIGYSVVILALGASEVKELFRALTARRTTKPG